MVTRCNKRMTKKITVSHAYNLKCGICGCELYVIEIKRGKKKGK